MKKIIHISDTHIGDKDADIKINNIVEKILSWKENASDYVIIHSGDVIADAKNGDYTAALAHFNKLKEAKFADILFVPGNHDYGTGVHTTNLKYVKKFNAFRANFSVSIGESYPVKKIIGNIAFIGLDSLEGRFSESADGEIDGIHGKFGDKQLKGQKGLSFILDSEDVKNCDYRVVYLHYHPTDFKPATGSKIEDSDEFKKILQGKKISALLFGHDHDKGNTDFNNVDEFEKCKEWGIDRIYDGGSLIKKKCFLRVIDLSVDPSFDEKWILSDTGEWILSN